KIDFLYHATVHFEVRKFVHNTKAEELSYDKMIEVAKQHERTQQEFQTHKQVHSSNVSSYAPPPHDTNKYFSKQEAL
ncbi:MAG: hypothetical protein MJE68_07905, partial [Proteobacteria bacterium]|nr:hypothetical protein [Pseudomonadota bacterium]